MSKRIEKVNELISQLLSQYIMKAVDLKPGIFVTISCVDTTPDLRYSKVFLSIFPESEMEYGLKTLQNERVKLQRLLHKKLFMKPLPKIDFILDTTESKADEVEKILNSLK